MRRDYHAMMDLTSPSYALKSPLPTHFDDDINPVFVEESEQETEKDTDKSTEARVRFAEC